MEFGTKPVKKQTDFKKHYSVPQCEIRGLTGSPPPEKIPEKNESSMEPSDSSSDPVEGSPVKIIIQNSMSNSISCSEEEKEKTNNFTSESEDSHSLESSEMSEEDKDQSEEGVKGLLSPI